MPYFLAMRLRADGTEPMGTSDQMIIDLKTVQGALKRARRYFGHGVRLYSFTNIYNQDTYRLITPGYAQCPECAFTERHASDNSCASCGYGVHGQYLCPDCFTIDPKNHARSSCTV